LRHWIDCLHHDDGIEVGGRHGVTKSRPKEGSGRQGANAVHVKAMLDTVATAEGRTNRTYMASAPPCRPPMGIVVDPPQTKYTAPNLRSQGWLQYESVQKRAAFAKSDCAPGGRER